MNPNYLTLALIAVVMLGYFGYKAYGLFTGVMAIATGTIILDKNSTLSRDRYRQLALGAIYSQQQGAPANTLKTGKGKLGATQLLGEWWSLYKQADAQAKLDELLGAGYRAYDVLVTLVAEDAGRAEIEVAFMTNFTSPEARELAIERLGNLRACKDELSARGYLKNPAARTAAGWDCGRVVFVARLCVDAGLLSEAQAWDYIARADALALQTFDSWEAFAESYVVGRAMWGGANTGNESIADIAGALLSKPDSPWVQMAWK